MDGKDPYRAARLASAPFGRLYPGTSSTLSNGTRTPDQQTLPAESYGTAPTAPPSPGLHSQRESGRFFQTPMSSARRGPSGPRAKWISRHNRQAPTVTHPPTRVPPSVPSARVLNREPEPPSRWARPVRGGLTPSGGSPSHHVRIGDFPSSSQLRRPPANNTASGANRDRAYRDSSERVRNPHSKYRTQSLTRPPAYQPTGGSVRPRQNDPLRADFSLHNTTRGSRAYPDSSAPPHARSQSWFVGVRPDLPFDSSALKGLQPSLTVARSPNTPAQTKLSRHDPIPDRPIRYTEPFRASVPASMSHPERSVGSSLMHPSAEHDMWERELETDDLTSAVPNDHRRRAPNTTQMPMARSTLYDPRPVPSTGVVGRGSSAINSKPAGRSSRLTAQQAIDRQDLSALDVLIRQSEARLAALSSGVTGKPRSIEPEEVLSARPRSDAAPPTKSSAGLHPVETKGESRPSSALKTLQMLSVEDIQSQHPAVSANRASPLLTAALQDSARVHSRTRAFAERELSQAKMAAVRKVASDIMKEVISGVLLKEFVKVTRETVNRHSRMISYTGPSSSLEQPVSPVLTRPDSVAAPNPASPSHANISGNAADRVDYGVDPMQGTQPVEAHVMNSPPASFRSAQQPTASRPGADAPARLPVTRQGAASMGPIVPTVPEVQSPTVPSMRFLTDSPAFLRSVGALGNAQVLKWAAGYLEARAPGKKSGCYKVAPHIIPHTVWKAMVARYQATPHARSSSWEGALQRLHADLLRVWRDLSDSPVSSHAAQRREGTGTLRLYYQPHSRLRDTVNFYACFAGSSARSVASLLPGYAVMNMCRPLWHSPSLAVPQRSPAPRLHPSDMGLWRRLPCPGALFQWYERAFISSQFLVSRGEHTPGLRPVSAERLSAEGTRNDLLGVLPDRQSLQLTFNPAVASSCAAAYPLFKYLAAREAGAVNDASFRGDSRLAAASATYGAYLWKLLWDGEGDGSARHTGDTLQTAREQLEGLSCHVHGDVCAFQNPYWSPLLFYRLLEFIYMQKLRWFSGPERHHILRRLQAEKKTDTNDFSDSEDEEKQTGGDSENKSELRQSDAAPSGSNQAEWTTYGSEQGAGDPMLVYPRVLCDAKVQGRVTGLLAVVWESVSRHMQVIRTPSTDGQMQQLRAPWTVTLADGSSSRVLKSFPGYALALPQAVHTKLSSQLADVVSRVYGGKSALAPPIFDRFARLAGCLDRDVYHSHAVTALHTARAREMFRQWSRERDICECTAVSPSGKYIAAGTRNGRVLVWRLKPSPVLVKWTPKLASLRFPRSFQLSVGLHVKSRYWNCWRDAHMSRKVHQQQGSGALLRCDSIVEVSWNASDTMMWARTRGGAAVLISLLPSRVCPPQPFVNAQLRRILPSFTRAYGSHVLSATGNILLADSHGVPQATATDDTAPGQGSPERGDTRDDAQRLEDLSQSEKARRHLEIMKRIRNSAHREVFHVDSSKATLVGEWRKGKSAESKSASVVEGSFLPASSRAKLRTSSADAISEAEYIANQFLHTPHYTDMTAFGIGADLSQSRFGYLPFDQRSGAAEKSKKGGSEGGGRSGSSWAKKRQDSEKKKQKTGSGGVANDDAAQYAADLAKIDKNMKMFKLEEGYPESVALSAVPDLKDRLDVRALSVFAGHDVFCYDVDEKSEEGAENALWMNVKRRHRLVVQQRRQQSFLDWKQYIFHSTKYLDTLERDLLRAWKLVAKLSPVVRSYYENLSENERNKRRRQAQNKVDVRIPEEKYLVEAARKYRMYYDEKRSVIFARVGYWYEIHKELCIQEDNLAESFPFYARFVKVIRPEDIYYHDSIRQVVTRSADQRTRSVLFARLSKKNPIFAPHYLPASSWLALAGGYPQAENKSGDRLPCASSTCTCRYVCQACALGSQQGKHGQCRCKQLQRLVRGYHILGVKFSPMFEKNGTGLQLRVLFTLRKGHSMLYQWLVGVPAPTPVQVKKWARPASKSAKPSLFNCLFSATLLTEPSKHEMSTLCRRLRDLWDSLEVATRPKHRKKSTLRDLAGMSYLPGSVEARAGPTGAPLLQLKFPMPIKIGYGGLVDSFQFVGPTQRRPLSVMQVPKSERKKGRERGTSVARGSVRRGSEVDQHDVTRRDELGSRVGACDVYKCPIICTFGKEGDDSALLSPTMPSGTPSADENRWTPVVLFAGVLKGLDVCERASERIRLSSVLRQRTSSDKRVVRDIAGDYKRAQPVSFATVTAHTSDASTGDSSTAGEADRLQTPVAGHQTMVSASGEALESGFRVRVYPHWDPTVQDVIGQCVAQAGRADDLSGSLDPDSRDGVKTGRTLPNETAALDCVVSNVKAACFVPQGSAPLCLFSNFDLITPWYDDPVQHSRTGRLLQIYASLTQRTQATFTHFVAQCDARPVFARKVTVGLPVPSSKEKMATELVYVYCQPKQLVEFGSQVGSHSHDRLGQRCYCGQQVCAACGVNSRGSVYSTGGHGSTANHSDAYDDLDGADDQRCSGSSPREVCIMQQHCLHARMQLFVFARLRSGLSEEDGASGKRESFDVLIGHFLLPTHVFALPGTPYAVQRSCTGSLLFQSLYACGLQRSMRDYLRYLAQAFHGLWQSKSVSRLDTGVSAEVMRIWTGEIEEAKQRIASCLDSIINRSSHRGMPWSRESLHPRFAGSSTLGSNDNVCKAHERFVSEFRTRQLSAQSYQESDSDDDAMQTQTPHAGGRFDFKMEDGSENDASPKGGIMLRAFRQVWTQFTKQTPPSILEFRLGWGLCLYPTGSGWGGPSLDMHMMNALGHRGFHSYHREQQAMTRTFHGSKENTAEAEFLSQSTACLGRQFPSENVSRLRIHTTGSVLHRLESSVHFNYEDKHIRNPDLWAPRQRKRKQRRSRSRMLSAISGDIFARRTSRRNLSRMVSEPLSARDSPTSGFSEAGSEPDSARTEDGSPTSETSSVYDFGMPSTRGPAHSPGAREPLSARPEEPLSALPGRRTSRSPGGRNPHRLSIDVSRMGRGRADSSLRPITPLLGRDDDLMSVVSVSQNIRWFKGGSPSSKGDLKAHLSLKEDAAMSPPHANSAVSPVSAESMDSDVETAPPPPPSPPSCACTPSPLSSDFADQVPSPPPPPPRPPRLGSSPSHSMSSQRPKSSLGLRQVSRHLRSSTPLSSHELLHSPSGVDLPSVNLNARVSRNSRASPSGALKPDMHGVNEGDESSSAGSGSARRHRERRRSVSRRRRRPRALTGLQSARKTSRRRGKVRYNHLYRLDGDACAVARSLPTLRESLLLHRLAPTIPEGSLTDHSTGRAGTAGYPLDIDQAPAVAVRAQIRHTGFPLFHLNAGAGASAGDGAGTGWGEKWAGGGGADSSTPAGLQAILQAASAGTTQTNLNTQNQDKVSGGLTYRGMMTRGAVALSPDAVRIIVPLPCLPTSQPPASEADSRGDHRSALVSWFASGLAMTSPVVTVSPVLDCPGTDFVYVFMQCGDVRVLRDLVAASTQGRLDPPDTDSLLSTGLCGVLLVYSLLTGQLVRCAAVPTADVGGVCGGSEHTVEEEEEEKGEFSDTNVSHEASRTASTVQSMSRASHRPRRTAKSAATPTGPPATPSHLSFAPAPDFAQVARDLRDGSVSSGSARRTLREMLALPTADAAASQTRDATPVGESGDEKTATVRTRSRRRVNPLRKHKPDLRCVTSVLYRGERMVLPLRTSLADPPLPTRLGVSLLPEDRLRSGPDTRSPAERAVDRAKQSMSALQHLQEQTVRLGRNDPEAFSTYAAGDRAEAPSDDVEEGASRQASIRALLGLVTAVGQLKPAPPAPPALREAMAHTVQCGFGHRSLSVCGSPAVCSYVADWMRRWQGVLAAQEGQQRRSTPVRLDWVAVQEALAQHLYCPGRVCSFTVSPSPAPDVEEQESPAAYCVRQLAHGVVRAHCVGARYARTAFQPPLCMALVDQNTVAMRSRFQRYIQKVPLLSGRFKTCPVEFRVRRLQAIMPLGYFHAQIQNDRVVLPDMMIPISLFAPLCVQRVVETVGKHVQQARDEVSVGSGGEQDDAGPVDSNDEKE